jgi:hypothetical protein
MLNEIIEKAAALKAGGVKRAKGKEPRAESKEQRAEGKEKKAEAKKPARSKQSLRKNKPDRKR